MNEITRRLSGAAARFLCLSHDLRYRAPAVARAIVLPAVIQAGAAAVQALSADHGGQVMAQAAAQAVNWVEQGLLPDRVVRLGIRRLLRERL
ncbi:MAG: hypothetical protein JNJ60_06355, partial [Rhodocyclaceae bacterium]|nr:hypothetical protein [Rhodocyclaceae bacterium]